MIYHLPKLCYSSIIMNDRINDHAHTTLAALSLFQFQPSRPHEGHGVGEVRKVHLHGHALELAGPDVAGPLARHTGARAQRLPRRLEQIWVPVVRGRARGRFVGARNIARRELVPTPCSVVCRAYIGRL